MKCEHVKELILTDYSDGQLEKAQKTQLEEHLTVCRDCREYELLTRTATVEPFDNLERHSPPEAAWTRIREQIEEEQLQENGNPFHDLIRRIKALLYIPKPVFAVTAATVLLLVVITVLKFPSEDRNFIKGNSDSQVECINYLMSVFDQETMNGNDDFGTSIEELFL
jgi:hypothetical protein